MTQIETKRHEEIAEGLLSMMNDIDWIRSNLYNLHENGFDYSEQLNIIGNMKVDVKKMLNKDFDRLAINKK